MKALEGAIVIKCRRREIERVDRQLLKLKSICHVWREREEGRKEEQEDKAAEINEEKESTRGLAFSASSLDSSSMFSRLTTAS